MFVSPEKILKQFAVAEDMIIADLGAGSGFYSIPLAYKVPKGKVYAIEVQKDFLKTIKNKAKDERLHNLEIIWGDVEKKGGTKIKDNTADIVIASNILFQVSNKIRFADEAFRILKNKGKLIFIDWADSEFKSGKYPIVSKDQAKNNFEHSGFIFEKNIDAGEHHYGMIFSK